MKYLTDMGNKRNRTIKKNAGFTLVEMIIAVGVVAILSSLVVAGIIGYLSASYTTRVNETAKTVFYAAQNELLEQKQLGKLDEFCTKANAFGGILSWEKLQEVLQLNMEDFDASAYEAAYSTDTTGYILMQKGSSESNPLYSIVQEATQDADLLKNTFLMEFDRTTGVVRAVFYSEQTDTFAYAGDQLAKDNVMLRSAEALMEKKQGYYGVDITGRKPVNEVVINDPENVILYNGERLYLEWQDTNKDNPEFDIRPELLPMLVYDVTVSKWDTVGNIRKPVFAISDLTVENWTKTITLDEADDALPAENAVRLAYDPAKRTFRLILDDIHHSLFQTYAAKNAAKLPPGVTLYEDVRAEDILICEVTAKLDHTASGLTAESFPSISNLQSSAFAGGEKMVGIGGAAVNAGGSGDLEDGGKLLPFGISCVRHLENIRYGENNSSQPTESQEKKDHANFVQTASINWMKAEGRAYDKPFEPINYVDQLLKAYPFQGTYTVKQAGGKYYTLSNMTIQQPEKNMTALFSMNIGEINGLTMIKPVIEGSLYTGTVAGVNGGVLKNITITQGTVKGSHVTGGVTGYNTAKGELEQITAECSVSGEILLKAELDVESLEVFAKDSKGKYIGGIAGLNKGKGTALTAGKKSTGVSTTPVTGLSYVGGIFGSNDTEAVLTVEKAINYSPVILAGDAKTADHPGYLGGITGYQGKGQLNQTENYGVMEYKAFNGMKPDDILYIGGITGKNDGTIDTCLNAGVDAARYTKVQSDCVAAIQKGTMPVYAGKYAGGIAGINTKDGVIKKAKTRNSAVTGYSVVGGIAGKNEGTVKDSGNALADQGVIIGTGYMVGGVFGYDNAVGKTADDATADYTNKANVFGKGVVGGIAGFNGKTEESGEIKGEDTLLTLMYGLPFDDTPGYYTSLLNIEQQIKPATAQSVISNCLNQGFVYARDCFSGGVAGINYGKVNQSNSVMTANGQFTAIHEKGSADGVGGIVGFNGSTGEINGQQTFRGSQIIETELVAGDFAGGVVGVNTGTVEGYGAVTGGIYAKGDCIGGVLGVNTNSKAIAGMTVNRMQEIKGGYFVGGVIGCNAAAESGGNATLDQIHSEEGKITGTAYVGGILGYNTYVASAKELGNLFGTEGELYKLKKNAFTTLPPESGGESGAVSVFKGCVNKSSVKGDRYVGGIIGFNSPKAKLWILGCNNNGLVELGDAAKTAPAEEEGQKVYYYYTGGITGRNSKNGVIHDSINNGNVKSKSTYLGGICEVNDGYVQFCATGTLADTSTTAGVTGDTNSVGGIVGLNAKDGKVVSCHADNYATIKGGSKTGGLVGTNAPGGSITSNITGSEAVDVSAAYGTAVPSGKDHISFCNAAIVGKDHTGGIVGYNRGSVANTEVRKEAKVTGENNVGGFIGYNLVSTDVGGRGDVISELTNYATVYGNHQVGGIVGKHAGSRIEKCTNAGIVTAYGNKTGSNAGKGYAGGITGSVTLKMTLEECTNYGQVISNTSFAGGITGINSGTLQKNNNYGTVEGATQAVSVSIDQTKSEATGSAIGGITGCNMLQGTITDCASRDRKDDPDGKDKNPFWDSKETNKIKGNFIAGGIIGYYARFGGSQSSLRNTSDWSKTVTITIEPKDQKINYDDRCKIGGFIGRYADNPAKETLKNYTFEGVIQVSAKAGQNQQEIGGIVGAQPSQVTLENCIFNGKITGNGNNYKEGEYADYAGVGGLAGSSNGSMIVYGMKKDDTVVYTSTGNKASIQGAKRVGGIVGEVGSQFEILIQKDGAEKAISLALLNDGAEAKDYIYYENYASVQGGRSVGGFFGAVPSGTSLKYLSNNGTILSMNINQKSNMGGIAGAAGAHLDYCRNRGQIGAKDDKNIMDHVGGIVGSYSGTAAAPAEAINCINEGTIYAGKSNIGGLFGSINYAAIRSSCKNTGDIIVNQSGITQVTGVGGIAGKASNSKITGIPSMQEMTMADKSIRLMGRGMAIGGIIGQADNKTEVTDVINLAALTEAASVNANLNKEIQAGGIIGNARQELLLSGCENKGTISFPVSSQVGGLIGISEGPGVQAQLSIVQCINSGEIVGKSAVGGLAGHLRDSKIIQFANNRNGGPVSGLNSVGGFIGWTQRTTGEVADSTNEGTINAAAAKSGAAEDASAVGGCVGLAETAGSVKLSRLVNTGDVTADQKNGIKSIKDMGGIAGCIQDARITVNASENSGKVTAVVSSQGKGYAIGGIVGGLRNGSYIGNEDSPAKRTVNKGPVEVTGDSGSETYEIGGIAGIATRNSRVMHCSNEGNVTGKTAYDIGGAVGKSYGLVLSCRAEKGVSIVGSSNVGGLVGRAVTYTSKVTSTDMNQTGKKTYDLSYSAAHVQGNAKVGGVVGSQQEATIYNVYATQDAAVTLLRTGTPENAAGGIVGYSGVQDEGQQTRGVVANCYSLATVTGESEVKNNIYMGGIIGFREHADRAKGEAANSVIDSFVVNPTLVDTTVPPSEEPGTVLSSAWAIGNEPLVTKADGATYMFVDTRDVQTASTPDPLTKSNKFVWSEDSYKQLCGALNITPRSNWQDIDSILEIMEKYDGFKLPAPPMNPVRVNDGFSYEFPFKPISGFYQKYEWKLYVDDIEVDTVITKDMNKTPVLHLTGDIDIGDEMPSRTLDLKNQLGADQIAQYVGKTISVSTRAFGYKLSGTETDDNILNYTKDSDEVVMQQFVIMPPLPDPDVKAVEVKSSDTDYFDKDGKQVKIKLEIQNWAEYEKAARTVYANLPPDDSQLAAPGLYDRFVNGLVQFKMTDGYNMSSGNGLDNNYTQNHTIMEKSAAPAGSYVYYEVDNTISPAKAYITIDYSAQPLFTKNYSTRPWHAFNIQAKTDAEHDKITVNPNSGLLKYRYTDSYVYTGTSYRLKSKLLQPKNLRADYTGEQDPETNVSYKLSWAKNTNKDSDVKGYKVELLYLKKTENGSDTKIEFGKPPFDGAGFTQAPYVIDVAGSATVMTTLTKEQLTQIFADAESALTLDNTVPWWDHAAEYSIGCRVTTIAADPEANLDSNASDQIEFKLLKRTNQVKDIAAKQHDAYLDLTWIDDQFDSSKPDQHFYEITYDMLLDGVSQKKETVGVKDICELKNIVIPPAIATKPFVVQVKIRKLGLPGSSLNGLMTEAELVIGKQLEDPVSVTIIPVKQEVNPEGETIIFVEITWDKTGSGNAKEIISADNCIGYQIDMIPVGPDNKEKAPISTVVTGFDTLKAKLQFSAKDVIKINFKLKALGKSPIAESSTWVSQDANLAATTLAAPTVSKLQITGTEVTDWNAAEPAARADYQAGPGLSYDILMNINDAAAAGQRIQITIEDVLLWEGKTTFTNGSDCSMLPGNKLLQENAGKEVKVLISNQSSNLSIALPSVNSEMKFKQPRMRLNQPTVENLSFNSATGSDLYTAEIPLLSGLTDTTAQAEERAARTGIRYELVKLSDTPGGTDTAVTFSAYSKDGAEQAAGVTSYTVSEAEAAMEGDKLGIYFKPTDAIAEADRSKYKIKVTVLAKTEAENIKYADSTVGELALSSAVLATTPIVAPAPLPTPLPTPPTLPLAPDKSPAAPGGTTPGGTTPGGTTPGGTTPGGTTPGGTTPDGTTPGGTTPGGTTPGGTTPGGTTPGGTTPSVTTPGGTTPSVTTPGGTTPGGTTGIH